MWVRSSLASTQNTGNPTPGKGRKASRALSVPLITPHLFCNERVLVLSKCENSCLADKAKTQTQTKTHIKQKPQRTLVSGGIKKKNSYFCFRKSCMCVAGVHTWPQTLRASKWSCLLLPCLSRFYLFPPPPSHSFLFSLFPLRSLFSSFCFFFISLVTPSQGWAGLV